MSKYTASDIRSGDYVVTVNRSVRGVVTGHTISALSGKPALLVSRKGKSAACVVLVDEVGTVLRVKDVISMG